LGAKLLAPYHSEFSEMLLQKAEDAYRKGVVYHDEFADYSTNEPTMDGTPSLCFYLGYLNSQANANEKSCRNHKE